MYFYVTRENQGTHLVHLCDDRNEEAGIQIAFAHKTFDEGDHLCARPPAFRENVQNTKSQALGTDGEGTQQRKQLAMRRAQCTD